LARLITAGNIVKKGQKTRRIN